MTRDQQMRALLHFWIPPYLSIKLFNSFEGSLYNTQDTENTCLMLFWSSEQNMAPKGELKKFRNDEPSKGFYSS